MGKALCCRALFQSCYSLSSPRLSSQRLFHRSASYLSGSSQHQSPSLRMKTGKKIFPCYMFCLKSPPFVNLPSSSFYLPSSLLSILKICPYYLMLCLQPLVMLSLPFLPRCLIFFFCLFLVSVVTVCLNSCEGNFTLS